MGLLDLFKRIMGIKEDYKKMFSSFLLELSKSVGKKKPIPDDVMGNLVAQINRFIEFFNREGYAGVVRELNTIKVKLMERKPISKYQFRRLKRSFEME